MNYEASAAEFFAKVTNAYNFLQYNLSPYGRQNAEEYAAVSISATRNPEIADEIASRFADKFFTLTESGRSALALALESLGLQSGDEVWIETTSNNLYISGCVTSTIEKYCGWSRTYNKRKTKAILINHEFGFPVENAKEYREYGLPIIEDCAYSFLSENASGNLGESADFILISFPKFLPVPWGGGLYSKKKLLLTEVTEKKQLVRLINHYARDLSLIKDLRQAKHKIMAESFSKHGLHQRFEMRPNYVPGAFMMSTQLSQEYLHRAKLLLNSQGIQSSVFYGESSYYVPCHQYLSNFDIEYIVNKTVNVLEGLRDSQ